MDEILGKISVLGQTKNCFLGNIYTHRTSRQCERKSGRRGRTLWLGTDNVIALPKNRSIEQLIDWGIDGSVDQWIDRLIDWFIHLLFKLFLYSFIYLFVHLFIDVLRHVNTRMVYLLHLMIAFFCWDCLYHTLC